MIRTIIIDDDDAARDTIAEKLKLYCKNVHVLAQASDVKSGVKAINNYSPDLVLLDIVMPDGTGFDVLNQVKNRGFRLIFITAHEEHAVKAFKFSALDYLLKPVDNDDLISAISKAENNLNDENTKTKLDTLLSNLENNTTNQRKIVLKTVDKIYIVETQEIVRCESDNNYSRIFLRSGKEIYVAKTLKEFDDLLKGFDFYRVHQTHLINLNFVECFERSRIKGQGGNVIMKNNISIPVSQRKKENLIQLFNNFKSN